MPLKKKSSSAVESSVTVILFSVIVPVLSEHITDVQPSVSTLWSLFTRTFCFIMRLTASARAIVTVAGSPSGIAAIAMVIPVMSISKTFSPRRTPAPKTAAQTMRHIIATAFPSSASRFCKGVCSLPMSVSIPDIFPICVSMPVAMTFPRHEPFTAEAPQ